jgi:hypothetical protein
MTGQPSDPGVTSSYDVGVNEWALSGPPALLTLLGAVVVIGAEVRAPLSLSSLPVAAFYVLILGPLWYVALSVVRRLELTADTLRWQSALRSYEIPLTQLRRMRPGRNGRAEVIELVGRRPIRFGVCDGLEEFAADVKAAAPQLEVTFADRPDGYRPIG